jgi:hypothetical protein
MIRSPMLRRTVRAALTMLALAALWVGVQAWRYLDAHESFKKPDFDAAAPQLPADIGDNAILVFSKTNGYRHIEAIPAVEELFRGYAQREGLRLFVTENAAVFEPTQLRHFRLVVWNNNTGDVLLPAQQAAFRAWLEGGGRWLGIHGAGGWEHWGWAWYPQELVRAQFIGHTLMPHIPVATLVVEDRTHPATAHLPARWTRAEEWYSFAASPRPRGHVLAWWHRVGQGYAFYSALGHEASAYAEPEYRNLLLDAARWLMGVEDAPAAVSASAPTPASAPAVP